MTIIIINNTLFQINSEKKCSVKFETGRPATQVWNMLPDDIRTSESLIAFKRAIQDITV